jgi:hypothetical protein
VKIRMQQGGLPLGSEGQVIERDSCAEGLPLDSYIAQFIICEGPCSKEILDFEFLY